MTTSTRPKTSPARAGIARRWAGPLLGLGCILLAAPCLAANEAAPVAAEPQETSASFGDWVVRCQRVGDPAKRVCEVAQSLLVKGQQSPVAQIAFATANKDQLVTVLLPTNIAFDKPPQIGPDETHMTTLTIRRCVPGGCLADSKLDSATLRAMRSAGKPGRLVFTDASERTLALPISFRGLAQALDALAKGPAGQ